MALYDGKVRIGTKLDSSGLESGLKNIKSLLAGMGIAKIFQEAIKSYATFETGLAKASTLFGDVNVDTEGLKSSMLDLSTATGETTDTLNEGLYTALSAGIPVTEDMGSAMAFMTANTKLAKAGFTDVNTAVGATSKVLNAYKMDVSEIDRVSNVLMATQNKGITTVGELSTHLAQVTPIASAMGVSFEDVGASLATMTAQGTPTAQAATQLRQVISELGKSGTIASENLKTLAEKAGMSETSFTDMLKSGKSLGDILDFMQTEAKKSGSNMIDMFSSIEAGQGALALSGDNAETLAKNLAYMGDSTGLVEDAYGKMADTLGTQMSRVKTIILGLSNSLLDKLLPSITDGVDKLETFTKILSGNYSASAELEGSYGDLKTALTNYNDVLDDSLGKTDALTQAMVSQAKAQLETALNEAGIAYNKSSSELERYARTITNANKDITQYEEVMGKMASKTDYTTDELNRMSEAERMSTINVALGSAAVNTYNENLILRNGAVKNLTDATIAQSQAEANEEAFINLLTQGYIDQNDATLLLLETYPELETKVKKNVTAYENEQKTQAKATKTAKEYYDSVKANVDMTEEEASVYAKVARVGIDNAKNKEELEYWTSTLALAQAKLTGTEEEAIATTSEIAEQEEARADILKTANDGIANAIKQNDLLGDSYDLNAEKSSIYLTAIKDLIANGEDPQSKTITDLTNKYLALQDAQADEESILGTLATSIKEVDELQAQYGDTFDGNSKKIELYQAAIEELTDEGFTVQSKSVKALIAKLKDLGVEYEKSETQADSFSDGIEDGILTSIGMTSDEFQEFMDNMDNAEGVLGKTKVMFDSIATSIGSGMLSVLDDTYDALGAVTLGSESWGDAMKSVGGSITDVLGDIMKDMAKQLAAMAVFKAVAGDWTGAALALGGAIVLGYSGGLIGKLSSMGVDVDEEDTSTSSTPATYEEDKAAEATSLKAQISTAQKDQARAKQGMEASTDPSDIKYYTEMYLELGEDIADLQKELQFAQGFATGGIVGGSSYTGDKLLSYVNSKEMILTQEQQASLYDRLSALSGMATQSRGVTVVVNVNGDSFGVDDFYSKVYNGISQLQYEGALKTW